MAAAVRVSGTRTTHTPLAVAQTDRGRSDAPPSTSTATAPRASAGPTDSGPPSRWPGTAMNNDPGDTRWASKHVPAVISVSGSP
jgi:hypothetical protein